MWSVKTVTCGGGQAILSRRFAPDVTISTLFDWVDVTFEVNAETVILTTMNGPGTFSWDSSSQTLEETGGTTGRSTVTINLNQRLAKSLTMAKAMQSRALRPRLQLE
jgi:hypothetical protein